MMNAGQILAAAISLLVPVLLTCPAQAALVPVINPSFEADGFVNQNTVPGSITGWPIFNDGSTKRNDFTGAHDVDNGLSPRPDGTAYNYWSNGMDAYQVLTETLQPNTRYTLTVDVGDRDNTPEGRPDVQLGYGGTPGANLLTPALATKPLPPNGGWTQWDVFYETGATPAGLGQPLRIELTAGSGAGTDNYQAQFDQVRLDATSIGPPALTIGFDMDVGSGASTADGFVSMYFEGDSDPDANASTPNPFFGGGGTIVASTSSAGVNRDRGTIDPLLDEFAGSNDPLFVTVSGIPTGLYEVETFHADFTSNLIPFDPDATSDVSLSTDGGTTFGTPMTANITGGPGAPHSALFQNVAITAGMDLVIQTVGSGNQGTGRINGFTITQVTVIPEPSTILIWSLLAALGISVVFRRPAKRAIRE